MRLSLNLSKCHIVRNHMSRLIFGYLRELKPAMRAIYSEIVTAEFFLGHQLILQKSNGYFQRKLSFSEVPGGWGGGVQLLIPYRNPYNL